MTPDDPLQGEASTAARKTSLLGRLINVIAAPGEVFDEVRSAPPSAANWLVPVVLVTIASILSFAIIFSQPFAQHQFREGMEKGMDQQVAAGKLPADKAAEIKEQFDKVPIWIFLAGGVVMSAIYGGVSLTWWALVVWVAGRRLARGSISFSKAFEVSGLSMMIYLLGVVVTTLMVFVIGDINSRPAPSAFLGQFDPVSKTHLALALLNGFYLWWMAVVAVGTARIAGVAFSRAALWVFGVWLVIRLGFLFIGLGSFLL